MSIFKTRLPVDLKPALAALPKGAFVHDVEFNPDGACICFTWSHDNLSSGLTVATDFDLDDLKKRVLPEGVVDVSKRRKKTEQDDRPPAPAPVLESVPAPKAPDYIRTEPALQQALRAGRSLEFWGQESSWKALDASTHEFTPGFVYRVVEKKGVDAGTDSGVKAESQT